MKDIVVLSGESWRWVLMFVLFMVIGAIMWDFFKIILREIIVQQERRKKTPMSNICFTNVRIRFQSEAEARKMEGLIKSSLNEEKLLSSLVENLNLGEIKARGMVDEIVQEGSELIIHTSCAWRPFVLLWDKMVSMYSPGAEVIYLAEETQCDVYQTNDEFLKGKYIIDFADSEDYQSNREASEETVTTMLQWMLDTEETEIDKLLSQYNEMPISSQMHIRKWEFVPISECA